MKSKQVPKYRLLRRLSSSAIFLIPLLLSPLVTLITPSVASADNDENAVATCGAAYNGHSVRVITTKVGSTTTTNIIIFDGSTPEESAKPQAGGGAPDFMSCLNTKTTISGASESTCTAGGQANGTIGTGTYTDYTSISCVNTDTAAKKLAARTASQLTLGAGLESSLCGKTTDTGYQHCVSGLTSALGACLEEYYGTHSENTWLDAADVATVATCIYNKTGGSFTTVKLSAALTKSVADAQKAANGALESKARELAQKECETRAAAGANVEWKDGACVEKAVGSNTASCSGGALGWLLCPLMDLMSSVIGQLANAIGDFMKFQPLTGSDSGKAIQAVWQVTVVPANLILVIAFLIVIFSQATSMGLSAYGIKKMLPRIIAAAILINLSFFICSILVDIFNILGASVAGIFQNASSALPQGSGSVASYNSLEYAAAVWTLLQLLATATTVAVLVGGIAFILPVALSAFVSLLVVFGVLAIRHIVAILLIIIAPLAFAAMVLPNTEGLFKKWGKMLIVTLALYPVIMALAYGSLLASKIILLTGPSGNDGTNSWSGIITTAVAFITLFAWIWALKFVMSWGAGFVGKLAGMVNDRSKGLVDRSRKFAQQSYKRGAFGQAMANRTSVLDDRARRNSIRKMESGHGWSALTGLGLGSEGRQIRSTYLADAKKQLDEREVAGHSSNLTKQAASMLASGYKREGNEWIARDEKGNIRKNAKGEELRAMHSSLDVGTRGALDYAMDNGLIGSKNGSRAIAKSLVDTGEARMDHIERLAMAIGDTGERATFIEHTRSAAQSAGLDQLKYMGVDANGNVDWAGVTRGADYKAPDPKNKAAVDAAKASAKETVAKKMSTSKLSGINKYSFDEADPIVVETLGSQLVDIEGKSPARFDTELAGMGADGVAKMAKMIAKSSAGKTKFAGAAAGLSGAAADDAILKESLQWYAARHNAARATHHSP